MEKKKTRDELKKLFGAGQVATAESFSNLIDSTVNIVDDRVEGKLELVSEGENESAIKFKKERLQSQTIWEIANNKDNSLIIKMGTDNVPLLTLHPDKSIVLGNDSDIRINGRIHANAISGNVGGNYEFQADGFWHELMKGSKGAKSYEITASCVADEKNHSFFLTKAYATQFNNKPILLKKENRSWKTIFSKYLQFKWVEEEGGCILKIRTNKNYLNAVIKVSILEVY